MTISGLASGLDTEEIISQLMEIERAPVTRLETRKTELEAQKSAWTEIRTALLSLSGSLLTLRLSSTFNARTVTSSDQTVVYGTATASAAEGTYKITVTQLAQAHKIASNHQIEQISIEGTLSITVDGNDRDIALEVGDTLAEIRDKINTGAGDIVTATIIDSRLVLTSKTTGEQGDITLGGSEGILEALGLEAPLTLANAQNALFTVDGLQIVRSSNTVTDLIEGVTLNLVGLTEGSEEVTLEVARDTDTPVEAVQDFVEKYNSAMQLIAETLGKNSAGEKGDLFGDPTLARIQQQLRRLVFDPVSLSATEYTTAASIGLSTGSVSTALTFDRSGQLTLDTDKLTQALEEDPDGVYDLFASSEAEGIAVRLDEYLDTLTKASLGTSGSPGDGIISVKEKWLENSIEDIEEQIERWELRLELKEEQLRAQFTAMESVLATLQSQATWLALQVASLSGLSLTSGSGQS
ncbi:MAG: flagellar filament capping protein FliD [Clostridia bacterium]|jgi:flagellar hook-associated protein 2|nr:flagellar filament capping protein FliD [Clostridia bacterium]MDH7573187.1 flagellar filament capping protein FliD [Clostridia bacterium]